MTRGLPLVTGTVTKQGCLHSEEELGAKMQVMLALEMWQETGQLASAGSMAMCLLYLRGGAWPTDPSGSIGESPM